MATAPTRTAAAPPPIGGNCNIRGATRRRHADSQLLMLQTPTATSVERAAGAEGQAGAPVGVGSPATAHTEGATAKQISPNKNHAVPLRYKTLPARAARPHFRYKTLPAHPKWLDLALFLHAGRVLYRSHHQEAEQGEFCTEREAETGLANRTPGPTGVEDVSRAWSRQISHVISLGHFLRSPENVAIPTARIQCLK